MRAFSSSKIYLAEWNQARTAGSRRRKFAIRMVNRLRRSRGLLTEAIFVASLDRPGTGTRASSETKRGVPDRPIDGQTECAVQPSSCYFSGTERARLGPRVRISALVMDGSIAHSRSSSGEIGGGRGRDTTMVIRRLCVIVVTVYLALILVVPSRRTRTMAANFLVVVRAR